MRHRSTRIPSYRHHQATGQARVTIDGRDHYLGAYNSPESRDRYRRLIAEHLGRSPKTIAEDLHETAGEITVEELLASFWEDAQVRYLDPEQGRTSTELEAYKVVLRHLRRSFGELPASQFGPLKLRMRQRKLIDEGLSRRTVNQHVRRAVKVFKLGSR
jgi:hypothetical protein